MAGVITGNVQSMVAVSLTLSPASVAANTTAEQTFTCPGIRTSDFVCGISKPTAQAGLGIVGLRVTAANTVGITFSNNTAAPIVPTASEVYLVQVARPDSVQPGVNV